MNRSLKGLYSKGFSLRTPPIFSLRLRALAFFQESLTSFLKWQIEHLHVFKAAVL